MPSTGHLKDTAALISGVMCAFKAKASALFTFTLYPECFPNEAKQSISLGTAFKGSDR